MNSFDDVLARLDRDAPKAARVNTNDPLAILARALLPHLRAELAERAAGPADFVDVGKALPTLRRKAFAACRAGELPARKVHRHWIARGADLDAWLEANDERSTDGPEIHSAEPADGLSSLRREYGLQLVRGA